MNALPRLSGQIALLAAMSCIPAPAQSVRSSLPTTPTLEGGYRLEIRVLVRGSAAARVRDRDWAELFQQAGHRVTIASDNGGEAPGIRTQSTGRRRVVQVVGLVDRGVLKLGTHKIRLGDVQPLRDILEDLEQHGADGPVRERPTWGLSVDQYTAVLKLLAPGINGDVPLSSPADVVRELRLPSELRVTWSPKAKKVAAGVTSSEETMDLSRLSLGSGLAVSLAQFGLGFRVMQHPRGGYLLEIDAGGEADNLWPIGWKNERPPIEIVPALYRSVEVDLQDEAVADVIGLVADRVELPWYQSRHQLAAQGLDLTRRTFSTPPARTMPSKLLRSIANENRMGIEPRTDEAGRLFLWCTTSADHAAWKKRFAHVVPGRKDGPSDRP